MIYQDRPRWAYTANLLNKIYDKEPDLFSWSSFIRWNPLVSSSMLNNIELNTFLPSFQNISLV